MSDESKLHAAYGPFRDPRLRKPGLPIRHRNPAAERWVCENPECLAEFAEYINGCPKCYPLKFSVRKTEEALEAQCSRQSSSTFGDLVQKCSTISCRIEPHEWDNMTVAEQRDWMIGQAEILHQQWADKWKSSLDLHSQRVAELEADRERLDWLALKGLVVKRMGNKFWIYESVQGYGFPGFYDTWREAIDAAMKGAK